MFRINSQSTSYRLRNTSTDLRLPKQVQKTARNPFRSGVRNFGAASQLAVRKKTPRTLLSSMYSYQMNVVLVILNCFHFHPVLSVVILFLTVTMVFIFLTIFLSLQCICILVGGAFEIQHFC